VTSAPRPFLLPERVRPVAQSDGLDEPFWSGLQTETLILQRCPTCVSYQWGPEYVCYGCGTDQLGWAEVPRAGDGSYRGIVYSWERVWHPVDPLLVDAVPYVVVLVELPDADQVRLVGNLADPPDGPVPIGAEVSAVFEHHESYTLLHWRLAVRAIRPLGAGVWP
jgi:uncharacterized OB-fold protein